MPLQPPVPAIVVTMLACTSAVEVLLGCVMDAWLLSSTLVRFALTLIPLQVLLRCVKAGNKLHTCVSACLDEQTFLLVAVVCDVVCKGLLRAEATIRVLPLALPSPLCAKQCCSLQHSKTAACACIYYLDRWVVLGRLCVAVHMGGWSGWFQSVSQSCWSVVKFACSRGGV